MTTRRKKVVSQAKPKTYIAIVFDRSDSMSSCWGEAIQAFNNQVEVIRRDAQGQDTSVTLITFSNNARLEFFNADPHRLSPLSTSTIHYGGMTALFDGVGLAVEKLKSVPDYHDPNVSFLVITITDGGENQSRNYNLPDRYTGKMKQDYYTGKEAINIANVLADTQRTDRWTFVFQVPPGAKRQFVDMGVPDDNVREWTNDRVGTIATDVATQSGLTNFFGARAAGQKSVSQFYVETDMSKVKSSDIKKKLNDESDRYKLYEVTQESVVKDFVESKTKRPYVIGQAYYLLMKKEKVQPSKGVLIMEKKKNAVWAGREARDLIGLPNGVEAKVEPGNHANYDIFIASTSVNRKLPRGTKVLIDVKMTESLKPTWDHETIANSK
jgi:hypothetical protein